MNTSHLVTRGVGSVAHRSAVARHRLELGVRRLDLLSTHLVHQDHDGALLRFGANPIERRATWRLGLALVSAVPASLLLVALPGAALVEWSGYWLVNESVLATRWMLYGLLAVAAGLVALALRPSNLWVRIDGRGLTLERPFARTRRVLLADIDHVRFDVGVGLWLELRDAPEVLIELPALDDASLYAMAQLIVERAPRARENAGSPLAVPASLTQIRRERQ